MKTKPDLLLLHGALGSSEIFKALAPLLNPGFDLHALTFSGHGDQPFNEHFGIATFAEEVLSYMDKNRMEHISIFGYSMGGYVAIYLSTKYPERVEKIFTLGTKFQWTPEYARKESTRLNPQKIKEKVPAFAAELNMRHTAFGWENVLSHTAEMMTELGNKNILSDDVLKGVSIPVCIGLGDRDNTVEAEEAVHVYRQLQAGSLMIFPATPHPLEKVDKELLSKAISAFLLK